MADAGLLGLGGHGSVGGDEVDSNNFLAHDGEIFVDDLVILAHVLDQLVESLEAIGDVDALAALEDNLNLLHAFAPFVIFWHYMQMGGAIRMPQQVK